MTKRIHQNLVLQLWIVGFAALMAQGEIDEHAPGRFDPVHDIPAGTEVDGGDSSLFDSASDQSDRLMVQWSGCHKEGRVCLLLFEHLYNFRHGFLLQCRAFIEPAHPQGNCCRRQTSDETRCGKPGKPFSWEYTV